MLKLRAAGELRRIARLEVCDNIFVGSSKCKGAGAMLRHLKYTKAVRQLAGVARQKAMDRDALYHGTRYAELILNTGVLFYSDPGQPKVSLTRSSEVAAYYALLERDYDEGRGSVSTTYPDCR